MGHEEPVFKITDKGREVINDIVERFAAGENVIEIAASHGLTEVELRVLIALDNILPIYPRED